MKKKAILFVSVFAVLFAWGMGCSSNKDSDVEKITESLADKLTDALDFEGGAVVEGAPRRAKPERTPRRFPMWTWKICNWERLLRLP